MTYILQDIVDHLKGSAAIQNAVSNHIYPEVIPQHVKNWEAAITVTEISNSPEYYLGGEAGTHHTMVQIDVYEDGRRGRGKLNELSELVRNRLSGYRGQFGTGAYGTARLEGNNSAAVQPVNASDQHKRRASMDFEIIHTAAVPTFT